MYEMHIIHDTFSDCFKSQYHMQLMMINRTLNCIYVNHVQDGWTPLITAADFGKCDVVLDLLDSGADVNAQALSSQT